MKTNLLNLHSYKTSKLCILLLVVAEFTKTLFLTKQIISPFFEMYESQKLCTIQDNSYVHFIFVY